MNLARSSLAVVLASSLAACFDQSGTDSATADASTAQTTGHTTAGATSTTRSA